MTSQRNGILDILVAEDGCDNRMLIRLFLKDFPCRIDMAETGEEAVRLFAGKRYDTVLMDMQLPVKDGFAAVREMRGLERERARRPAAIIAITGDRDEKWRRDCLLAGCDAVLFKPLSPQELVSAIRRTGSGTAVRADWQERLNRLIPEYLKHREQDVEKIGEWLEQGDYEEIARIGHRMKGSGRGYGLEDVSRIGEALEHAAKNGQAPMIEAALRQLADYLLRTAPLYKEQDG